MTGNLTFNNLRNYFFLSFLALGLNNLYAQDFFSKTNQFFYTHVQDGKVDYQSIKNEPEVLNQLVNHIAVEPYKQLTFNERKAYLINVYNLLVIKSVIANYPISSPMEVGGFFEGKKHTIAGKKYDLNALENDILRKDYVDSRLHFVLVCGAVGCPPIISEAYTPSKLEKQLDRQTKLNLNNPEFIRLNHSEKRIELSEIFSWYKADFLAESKGLKQYINKYREVPLPNDYKLEYYNYDWSLNNIEQKKLNNLNGVKPVQSFIQSYTPSSLLGKGHMEFSIFNNLYTETRKTDTQGNIFKVARETYFTSSLKFLYGVSKQKRINVGLIANIKSTSKNSDALSVLSFKNDKINQRSGLSSIAPVLKYTPLKNVGNFAIQSSLTIPLVDQPENPIFLDKDSYVWSNQLFYDISFAKDKFQLFTELDLNLIFGEKGEGHYANNSFNIPASVFLSYFPNTSVTFYSMIQHSPTYGLGSSGFDQDFTQFGFGGKYQLTDHMNLELLITDFFRGKDSGIGETYNLGLKYLL